MTSYKRYLQFGGNTCTYTFILFAFIWNELVLTAFNRILAFYDNEAELQKHILFILLGITFNLRNFN